MNTKQLSIKCEGSDVSTLDDLTPLQGDLKSLDKDAYKRLRASFEEHGFLFPFFYWTDPTSETRYLIDGHTRKHVLEMMRDDGWYIPLLPSCEVKASSLKEAKQSILLASSAYGKMNNESLSQFALDAEIEFEWLSSIIDIPGVDISLESDDSLSVVDGSEGSKETCPTCGK